MVRDRLCARLTLLAAGIVFSTALDAAAQPIGAFRWQLLPYCNVITLNVTAQGTVFTLDGYDDQCGAGQRASVVGLAFFNPDGTIGIGLSTVVAPGGAFVHVDARITLSSLGGPWRDSSGNSGTFTFTPGGGVGGPPRPVAPNGIAPGSITTAQLAPGSVTSIQIAPGSVTATQLAPGAVGSAHVDPNQVQSRVVGTCPVGQYLRGVNPNGTVVCEPLLALNVSTIVDDPPDKVLGFETAIAIGVDGLPVIADYDYYPVRALRVTHCGNAACTAGNVSVTIDDPSDEVGSAPSIAIGADRLPIISHTNQTLGTLRITHCGDAACASGNVSTGIAVPGSVVGRFSSIAIGADGLPIISHTDITSHALRVTHCANVTCEATNTSPIVDSVGGHNVGFYTSIAIGTDGLPVISHTDGTAGALRVTHCGNASCTAGNTSTEVDNPSNDVGWYSSIEIGADRLPVISHWDSTARGLRVTHCGDIACAAGNITTPVDERDTPIGFVGAATSIAIGSDGLPIVSHVRQFPAFLRVTHCGNATCTAGNVSANIDDAKSSSGFQPSIAIGVDGLPVISHWDGAASALRVTKCATRTCQ